MSDALNYLIRARPAAMKSYLAFLREAGRRLDPKTRALISVITKVDNQTERGFRQYLDRALREGCSPDEILDALLMAFPTLGLSKIIWAIDQLLDMDLPEFRLEQLNGDQQWHTLLDESELVDTRPRRVSCDGRSFFVTRVDGAIRVYDARCPHQSTLIPETALAGSMLTCPKHHWKFNLETGDCIAVGDRPLNSLECRVEQGVVQARW